MVDYRSMNETALLCLGILLEEMADEVLGETGDLALTEGEVVVQGFRTSGMRREKRGSDISTRVTTPEVEPTIATAKNERASPEPRKSKRRKTTHHKSDG